VGDSLELETLGQLEQLADGLLLEAGQVEVLGWWPLDLATRPRLDRRRLVAVEIDGDARIDGRRGPGPDLVAEFLDRDRVLGRCVPGRTPGPGGPLLPRCLFDDRGRAYRRYRLPAGRRVVWRGGVIAAPAGG
jgi:hypothetical protein